MPCYNVIGEDITLRQMIEDLDTAIEKSKTDKRGSACEHWGRITYRDGISEDEVTTSKHLSTKFRWKSAEYHNQRNKKIMIYFGKFGKMDFMDYPKSIKNYKTVGF